LIRKALKPNWFYLFFQASIHFFLMIYQFF
jgi:hypothetical protein